MPRLSRRSVLIAGLLIGLALWVVPWIFLAESEPWDGHGPAYPLALFLIGLGLGFLGPGRPGAAVAGVFAGQLVALVHRMLTHPGGNETWMIGVLLLGGYTFVVTGVGAFLGGVIRQRVFPPPEGRRVADRGA